MSNSRIFNSLISRVTFGALTVGALALASAAHAERWDMPMAYSGSNYHTETGVLFAQCVTTGTDNEIEIITHASGSLFKGADIKRAIQTGQAQIGERLLSSHQNENIVFGFDSVPFLATSFDDSARLFAAARPTMDKLLDEQNLVLLYAVPWPPQGFYANKEVNSVADMKGLKFRSYNNATAKLAELTGMVPVSIEAAEISQAFATGVAESMISSGATGYDRKVWESLSHFYEVDAWLPYNYVMVNKDVWEDTSEEHKSTILECAKVAEATGIGAAKEYTGFTVNGLREGGMTVAPASEALVGELKVIGETMTTEWLDEAGEDGKAILDAYNASR